MTTPAKTPRSALQWTAHPPERRRQGSPVILPCGCCSCCCCCLHTLGSLIGGIVGSTQPIRARARPVDPDFPFPFRRDEFDVEAETLPAGALYWLLVCLGLGVGSLWYFLSEGARRPEDLFYGFLVSLIFALPVVQLGASVVAALIVAVFYADRATSMIRVGKITLWSLVGTGIGIAIMGGFCGLLALGR
jgi:hypothetical protein